jgi:hypothetical protein
MWLEKVHQNMHLAVYPPHGRIKAGFAKKTDEEVRLH